MLDLEGVPSVTVERRLKIVVVSGIAIYPEIEARELRYAYTIVGGHRICRSVLYDHFSESSCS